MSQRKCDLLVIGGGPGGYTAAIRGAQKGLKAILLERSILGGTCLNRGCVPTKTLLEDAAFIPAVRNCHFLKGEMRIDLKAIAERRDLVVEGSRSWISEVLAGNGVEVTAGLGTFAGPKTVAVKGPKGKAEKIEADKIVISTGAAESYPAQLKPDGQNIWDSDEAIKMETVPPTLAVVGGGIRGVELASIYHNLGSRVALIEQERRILPRLDRGVANRCRKILADQGLRVLTRTKATAAKPNGDKVALSLASKKGEMEIQADKVLLVLSRKPSYGGLNLKAAGLKPAGGVLKFGPGMETKADGVYVIGDAAGGPYLAHKAIAQAIVAVDHLLGGEASPEPLYIPHCLYSNPEVASVGATEQEAKKSGRAYKLGEFYYIGNGRSGTLGNENGLVRMLSDSESGQVLGVHIIGPQATELIALATLAMQNGISIEDIKKTVFPHPTLSETFFEAALASDGEAIHLLLDQVEEEAGD